MESGDVPKLAGRLADARAQGRPIERLDDALRPSEVKAAYAVQAVAWARRGLETAGYKVGLTNLDAQRAFDAGAPIAGLLAGEDIATSPATLPADEFRKFAEAEIVFIIGQAFDPADAPFSEGQVRAQIASVHAGIEICSTRWAWDDPSLPELIADNSNAGALVVGEALPDWRSIDLTHLGVALRRRGQADIFGSTAAVLGDPVRAVAWLANWLASCGERLEAGVVVASGSCTGAVELSDDEELVADVAGLAQAHAKITPNREMGTKPS